MKTNTLQRRPFDAARPYTCKGRITCGHSEPTLCCILPCYAASGSISSRYTGPSCHALPAPGLGAVLFEICMPSVTTQCVRSIACYLLGVTSRVALKPLSASCPSCTRLSCSTCSSGASNRTYRSKYSTCFTNNPNSLQQSAPRLGTSI